MSVCSRPVRVVKETPVCVENESFVADSVPAVTVVSLPQAWDASDAGGEAVRGQSPSDSAIEQETGE